MVTRLSYLIQTLTATTEAYGCSSSTRCERCRLSLCASFFSSALALAVSSAHMENQVNQLFALTTQVSIKSSCLSLLLWCMDVVDAHYSAVCNTESCTRTSEIMRKNMNKSVDACDNFYQFACGNFKLHHKIPVGGNPYSYFSTTQEKVDELLINELSKPAALYESTPVSYIRQWFQKCIDPGEPIRVRISEHVFVTLSLISIREPEEGRLQRLGEFTRRYLVERT